MAELQLNDTVNIMQVQNALSSNKRSNPFESGSRHVYHGTILLKWPKLSGCVKNTKVLAGQHKKTFKYTRVLASFP